MNNDNMSEAKDKSMVTPKFPEEAMKATNNGQKGPIFTSKSKSRGLSNWFNQ